MEFDSSTSAPIGPNFPRYLQPQPVVWHSTPQQQCADGLHAWVPWLQLPNGSFVTWCARNECDHQEQFDI